MKRTLSALTAWGILAVAAWPIVPNLGVDSEFSFVGRNNSGTGGVIAVGPRAIMTARHITLGQFVSFSPTGGGTLYEVDIASQTDIGGSDIRMYRTLEDLPGWYDIDFSPLPVAYSHAASGSAINFTPTGGSAVGLRAVGYGQTGVLNGAGTGYDLTPASAGTRRQASFFSDSRGELTIGGVGTFSNILSFLVANPDGTLADQDSGGGLFRNVGGSWQLVGVNSFVLSDNLGRAFGTGDWNGRLLGSNSALHFASGFAELAPHEQAIRAFLVPEPASMMALASSLALLLARRKRAT